MYNLKCLKKMERFNKILVMVSLALLVFACKDDEVTDEPQKEIPSLEYTAGDINLLARQGDTSIVVKVVGGAYTATVADDGKDWCSTSSIMTSSFKISYKENPNAQSRSTTITLAMSNDAVSDISIKVTQFGSDPVLIIDERFAEATLAYDSLELNVPVSVNGDYTVTVEDGKSWISLVAADKTPTAFKLTLQANDGLDNRSAKVTVVHADAATVKFEFNVTQLSEPIHLGSPENETKFSALRDSLDFSWAKRTDASGYTLVISTSPEFPDGATSLVKDAGDVDALSIALSEISALVGTLQAENLFYWTVKPTGSNGFIETKVFNITQAAAETYPLTLNSKIFLLGNGDTIRYYNADSTAWSAHDASSWIYFYDKNGVGYEYDGDGDYMIEINGSWSSRRSWITTHPVGLSKPGGIPENRTIAVVYDYKLGNKPATYNSDSIDIHHNIDAWLLSTSNAGIYVKTLRVPITDGWITNVVVMPRTGRSDWGVSEDDMFSFFWRPTYQTHALGGAADGDGNTQIRGDGLQIHLRNIRIEVYD
jgi:hypothetical protein